MCVFHFAVIFVFLRQKMAKGLVRRCSISVRLETLGDGWRHPPDVRTGVCRKRGGARCSPAPTSLARWLSRDVLSNKKPWRRSGEREKAFSYSLNEAISIFYVSAAPACVSVCVVSFCALFFPPTSAFGRCGGCFYCETRRGRWVIWAADKGDDQSRGNADGGC